MYSFKQSEHADYDIYEMLSYTVDKWGYEQALKYSGEIDRGREAIQKDPFLIGSKSQDHLLKGCRSFRVLKHYFFYRVNEADKTVEIARVLNEQQDFPRHVTDEHFPE